MNTVVEIGSGLWPGPFIEGVDVHYAVDPILDRLPGGESSPFTPLKTDARNLDFANESVDLVLARNVFGDPNLGMSEAEKNLCFALETAYMQAGEYDELKAMRVEAEGIVAARKLELIEEAARVLMTNGQLVAVEQYTPIFADRFFRKAKSDIALSGLTVARTNLADVMPESYATAHDRAETWTLTKV